MVNGGNIMMTVKTNLIPDSQIQVLGLEALKKELGVVGTIKFLEQYDNGGKGNYTEEKYLQEDEELTKEEILEIFKK
jgi:hypothetical protein